MKFIYLLFVALFLIGCDNEVKPKPEETPVVEVDPDIAILNKCFTPSNFAWANRAPNIEAIKAAPVVIFPHVINQVEMKYWIDKFNGFTYEAYPNEARLENYTFKTNGELYVFKDWAPYAIGAVDYRWLNADDGWEEDHNGNLLPDFYSIVVHKNIITGEVFGRSRIITRKDFTK